MDKTLFFIDEVRVVVVVIKNPAHEQDFFISEILYYFTKRITLLFLQLLEKLLGCS